MSNPTTAVAVPASDPRDLAPARPDLTDQERTYIDAARADNTLRGYSSDWREWCSWCANKEVEPQPAQPADISQYLTDLASYGAKVGTMSRRLSSIRFAHRIRNLPDPTADARVIAVWEGIRRTHGAPPEQAAPLMPPELNEVLRACPTTRHWKGPRPDEPDLGGLRDRALLTVGFFAALRRSELAAMTTDDLEPHEQGLVLHIPRSKTNQTGTSDELVILPRCVDPLLCPVTNLTAWMNAAGVTEGPVLRRTEYNRPGASLTGKSINAAVIKTIGRAGIVGNYSAHSLRAGFVTYAHLRGASDRAIAHQTRHQSLATLGQYVRVHDAWTDNAAAQLGL